MYEIIHGRSVFYNGSFCGEVDFVERSFSKTFLIRFTFDLQSQVMVTLKPESWILFYKNFSKQDIM